MANAHLYAARLGLKTMSLKQRLGVVPSSLGAINNNLIDNNEPEQSLEPTKSSEQAKPND